MLCNPGMCSASQLTQYYLPCQNHSRQYKLPPFVRYADQVYLNFISVYEETTVNFDNHGVFTFSLQKLMTKMTDNFPTHFFVPRLYTRL